MNSRFCGDPAGGPADSRAGSAMVPMDSGWCAARWWDADAEAGRSPGSFRPRALERAMGDVGAKTGWILD